MKIRFNVKPTKMRSKSTRGGMDTQLPHARFGLEQATRNPLIRVKPRQCPFSPQAFRNPYPERRILGPRRSGDKIPRQLRRRATCICFGERETVSGSGSCQLVVCLTQACTLAGFRGCLSIARRLLSRFHAHMQTS